MAFLGFGRKKSAVTPPPAASELIDAQINVAADELEKKLGKSPLIILGAISLVEREILDEQYTGKRSVSDQRLVWGGILKAFHDRRIAVIRDGSTGVLPPEELEAIRRFISRRFVDLREKVKNTGPQGSSTLLHEIGLVDQAMGDCLTEDREVAPERRGLYVREICRLGYEAKTKVLNHQTP